MKLKTPAIPADIRYPNTLLVKEVGPPGDYAEETPPPGRGGRWFRLQNDGEIRKHARRAKWATVRKQSLIALVSVLIMGLFGILENADSEGTILIGLIVTTIIGIGYALLNIIGALLRRVTVHRVIVLHKRQLFFCDAKGEPTAKFDLAQGLKLEKRKVGQHHFLLFKEAYNPKIIAADSPAFVWEEKTVSLLEAAVNGEPEREASAETGKDGPALGS